MRRNLAKPLRKALCKTIYREAGLFLVTTSRVVVAVCMFHEAKEEVDIQPYHTVSSMVVSD